VVGHTFDPTRVVRLVTIGKKMNFSKKNRTFVWEVP
jgi:hypothetical protein